MQYKEMTIKNPRLRKRIRSLTGGSFSRASVAYDPNGNSVALNQPRFSMFGVSENGLLVEEAHTNLLSGAQSLLIENASPVTTGTLNGTYTFQCRTGNIVLSGGATGTVTPSNPVTVAVSSATVTLTPDTTATYNQIILKGYPLSWVLGGTEQKAETMTLPSSVLNIDTQGYSNLLTANQSTVSTDTTGFTSLASATIERVTDQTLDGHSLKIITPNGTINEGVRHNNTSVAASTTYTASLWIYGKSGTVKLFLTERTSDDSYVGTTESSVVTLNGTWQRVRVSRTFGSTGVNARMGVYTDVQQGITFYIDELQLSATSSVMPWVLGGTQSNTGAGTIEAEIYVNSAIKETTTAKYIFDCNGVGYVRLYHASGSDVFKFDVNHPGTTSSVSSGALTLDTWQNLAGAFNSSEAEFYVEGSSVGSPVASPKLPNAKTSVNIGSLNGGTNQANTLIKNLVISNPRRPDAEMTSRASQSAPPVDRQVTAILPLKTNLNAYKVGVN